MVVDVRLAAVPYICIGESDSRRPESRSTYQEIIDRSSRGRVYVILTHAHLNIAQHVYTVEP